MKGKLEALTINVKVNGIAELARLRKELEGLRKLGVKKKLINRLVEINVLCKEVEDRLEGLENSDIE